MGKLQSRGQIIVQAVKRFFADIFSVLIGADINPIEKTDAKSRKGKA